MSTKKITTDIKKLPNSQVEITVTLPIELVESYKAESVKRLQDTITIDGFRKGHVPESAIIERVGEMGLLAEMADSALTTAYAEIMKQADVSPISRPVINATTLAPGNDVVYTITTDVMPTVELKDIAKIAKEKNKEKLEVELADADVDNAIRDIRQMRAHQKLHDDGHEHDDHNHQNIPDDQLPEFNDEFVKSLGAFESVEDFKTKLRENMTKEKEAHAHEKRRIEIIEAIVADGTFDIPGSMVDFELDKMLEQFKYDLSMSGMKIEDYMTHIGKNMDEMKTEWRAQAIKRVQMQLSLDKIATDFNIKPDADKVTEQIAQIMEMYKDQQVEEANVTAYVNQMSTNAAVFDWLEAQK
jgi:FKBP-type peptidyl-prolyl cis-trans isomerase (trigger factor)